jgi:hypothetical protein
MVIGGLQHITRSRSLTGSVTTRTGMTRPIRSACLVRRWEVLASWLPRASACRS